MILFSHLTMRMMIVHDSFSISCFGNHWPDSDQKTCCRPFSSRKIHTFTSLSYGTPSCCLLTHRRRSKEYLHGFRITTASSCSYLVRQSSFLSSTEPKMRLVHYISFYPVFLHALVCKCLKSLCQRDLQMN